MSRATQTSRTPLASIFVLSLAVGGMLACDGDGGGDDCDDDCDDDFSDWQGGCTDDAARDLSAGMSWQWQLMGTIDTSLDVQMYEIDLFDAPQSVIDSLHAAGRTVICYFSAGTWEDWRDDAADFPAAVRGNTPEGWEDEKWLDVRSTEVRALMMKRLDAAVAKGCDGVDPDNMDGYLNRPGFNFDGYDQLDYNKLIADEAHARGLSVGLKNDVDQIAQLESCFDWALNEECLAWDECHLYAPFLASGKAVFHVEYVDDIAQGPALASEVCGEPAVAGFSTLIKEWDVLPWRLACP